jgi:sigma-B regulation protein RsbU (phosphoserine phosphatase)
VGLLENYSYEQGCATLADGDLLVAYTDGVSEAMNTADEEWGEQSMIEAVKLCVSLPAREILQRILEAADAFVAGAKQHDDMTLVILKVSLVAMISEFQVVEFRVASFKSHRRWNLVGKSRPVPI